MENTLVIVIYFCTDIENHKDNFKTMSKCEPFFGHLIFQQNIDLDHHNMDILSFIANIEYHIIVTLGSRS